MIEVGDRIVTTHRNAERDVSGIVALAIDIGMADWALALWGGFADGRKTFDVACLNEFAVEVVERGIPCPKLPEPVADKLRRAADISIEDAKLSAHYAEWKDGVQMMRTILGRQGFKSIARGALGSLREKMSAMELSESNARGELRDFTIRFIRDSIGQKGASINDMQLMFCACKEEFDEVIAEMNPASSGR